MQTNPAEVVEVLAKLFEKNTPDFDLDDKLRKMIEQLAEAGYRDDAIRFVEKLRRTLPGMLEFYKELLEMPCP